MKPGMDTSEMRSFSAELGRASSKVAPQVLASLKTGAGHIKDGMADEASRSQHFSRVAEAVNYDVTADRSGFSAEIGPRVGVGQGSLAHIAYFGGSRGGGNTLDDPQKYLDEEIPKFESALGDIMGGAL